MQEVFDAAFTPNNLVPTVLLIIILIYWLLVILGAMDVGFLDFDIDADYESDFEIEIDLNTETEIDTEVGSSWFMEFLSWFNLGKVPFMVFVTCVSIPSWFISININHYLGIQQWWISVALYIPNLIFCFILAKFLTIPLVSLFAKLDADEQESINPIGKKCKIILPTSSFDYGQAEIRIEGTTNLINVITQKDILLSKGDTALVIEKGLKNNTFLVVPYTE